MNYDDLDLAILKTLTVNKKYALDYVHQANERLFSIDSWKFAKMLIEYIKVYKACPTRRIIVEKTKQAKNDALLKYVEAFWNKLDAFAYDDKEYPFDFEKIKERYSKKLINNLKETLNNENSFDVKKNVSDIQFALNNIESVNSIKPYKEATLKEYTKDFMHMYREREKDPNFGCGVLTGFSFIDQATAGLRSQEMFLVAATTGGGKSVFLTNMAVNMWMGGNTIEMLSDFRQGVNILYLSLEMKFEDCAARMISKMAQVPQKGIRDAVLTNDEKGRVNKALKFINAYDHSFKIIDTPKLTSQALELTIENEIAIGNKPTICVVDYLNLMKPSIHQKEMQDWREQGQLAEDLHQIARSYDLIMLSAIQLNPKGNDKEGGEFGIKSVRRATEIIDNCDLFAVIQHRKNEKSYPDISVSLLKNRRGELSEARLHKDFACCTIADKKVEAGIDDIDDISGIV